MPTFCWKYKRKKNLCPLWLSCSLLVLLSGILSSHLSPWERGERDDNKPMARHTTSEVIWPDMGWDLICYYDTLLFFLFQVFLQIQIFFFFLKNSCWYLFPYIPQFHWKPGPIQNKIVAAQHTIIYSWIVAYLEREMIKLFNFGT